VPTSISGKYLPPPSKRIVVLHKLFSRKRLLVAVRETIGHPPATERILLVDDEEALRDIMSQMLSFAGYRCRCVRNGVDALKLLESGEQFDLITSDVANSPMSGTSFLEEVTSRFPDIPVLMVTAAHDISLLLACVRKGAYDFVLKPFELEQLTFAIRQALESRRLKLENRALRAKLARTCERK
jgi:DNA-binding NtrC family response regulator